MKKLIGAITMMGVIMVGGCDVNANTAKNGDTVVIDFAGFLGDKQFEGGTANGFPLKLGSGQFVPGFEEQLIGAAVGDKRDVKITFPTNYYPELAGKDVVFKVTVNEIIKK